MISAIVHFFTAGVTFERFHAIGESAKKKLDDTRCYWNDQHRLVVVLNGQEYELDLYDAASHENAAETADHANDVQALQQTIDEMRDAIVDIAKASHMTISEPPKSGDGAILLARRIAEALRPVVMR